MALSHISGVVADVMQDIYREHKRKFDELFEQYNGDVELMSQASGLTAEEIKELLPFYQHRFSAKEDSNA